MAFEKLKKNQTMVPRAAPLSAPQAQAPAPKPGVGQQLGMMAADEIIDTGVAKGAEWLFKKTAADAATTAATSAATGVGTAAAMTNPVTAPLAIASLVAPKLLGK